MKQVNGVQLLWVWGVQLLWDEVSTCCGPGVFNCSRMRCPPIVGMGCLSVVDEGCSADVAWGYPLIMGQGPGVFNWCGMGVSNYCGPVCSTGVGWGYPIIVSQGCSNDVGWGYPIIVGQGYPIVKGWGCSTIVYWGSKLFYLLQVNYFYIACQLEITVLYFVYSKRTVPNHHNHDNQPGLTQDTLSLVDQWVMPVIALYIHQLY